MLRACQAAHAYNSEFGRSSAATTGDLLYAHFRGEDCYLSTNDLFLKLVDHHFIVASIVLV
jgi:hypothetical protein